MITVTSAITTETRERDQLRNRILISIGQTEYHLTRAEAEKLAGDLSAVLLASHKVESDDQ